MKGNQKGLTHAHVYHTWRYRAALVVTAASVLLAVLSIIFDKRVSGDMVSAWGVCHRNVKGVYLGEAKRCFVDCQASAEAITELLRTLFALPDDCSFSLHFRDALGDTVIVDHLPAQQLWAMLPPDRSVAFTLSSKEECIRTGMRPLDVNRTLAMGAATAEIVPREDVRWRVLLTCNYQYVRVLQNWIAHYRRAVPDDERLARLLVHAMDEQTVQWCTERGIEAVLDVWDREKMPFSEYRVAQWLSVLGSGTSFVNSDVDALWLRNPLELLDEEDGDHGGECCRGADLMFSKGTTWPAHTYQQQGWTVCTGFFAARSNERTVALYARVLNELRERRWKCDQASTNLVLFEHASHWNLSEPAGTTCRRSTPADQCWNFGGELHTSIDTRPHPLHLCVLSDCLVRRGQILPEDRDGDEAALYVIHSVTPKDGTTIETALAADELWLLKD